MDKLIKDSYLGSIHTNKIKNSPNRNESLNYPKKSNAPIDIKNNENIIKNLRAKIQRQEIDLKFLYEKLKRLQSEDPNNGSEILINSRIGSKLNVKEVNLILILRLKILLIYCFIYTIKQSLLKILLNKDVVFYRKSLYLTCI